MKDRSGLPECPFHDTRVSRRSFLGLTVGGVLAVSGCAKAPAPSTAVDPKRLHNALEGIRSWLAEHSPDVAHGLQPGLTASEIETMTANLPFSVPQEECLLYQWHNGSCSDGPFIFNHRFLSLHESIEFYAKNLAGGWQTSWFPMFLHKGDAYFVAPFGFKSKTLPIRHFTLQSSDSPNAFTNLTTMMETALEWYKAGAVRIEKGALIADEEKRRKIFERHNPGLLFPHANDD